MLHSNNNTCPSLHDWWCIFANELLYTIFLLDKAIVSNTYLKKSAEEKLVYISCQLLVLLGQIKELWGSLR